MNYSYHKEQVQFQSSNTLFINNIMPNPIILKLGIPMIINTIFLSIRSGLNNHSVVKMVIGSIQVLGITPQLPKIVAITVINITIATETLNISFIESLTHLFIALLSKIFYGHGEIKSLDETICMSH